MTNLRTRFFKQHETKPILDPRKRGKFGHFNTLLKVYANNPTATNIVNGCTSKKDKYWSNPY